MTYARVAKFLAAACYSYTPSLYMRNLCYHSDHDIEYALFITQKKYYVPYRIVNGKDH